MMEEFRDTGFTEATELFKLRLSPAVSLKSGLEASYFSLKMLD